jgi:hypothetical protein
MSNLQRQNQNRTDSVTHQEPDAFSREIQDLMIEMNTILVHIPEKFHTFEASFDAHGEAMARNLERILTILRAELSNLGAEFFRSQTLVFDYFPALRA